MEDPAVVAQPFGRHDLDDVVEDEEGAVLLKHQLLSLGGVGTGMAAGLDPGLQDGEELRPLLGHVEAGNLPHYHGQLQSNRIGPAKLALIRFGFNIHKIHTLVTFGRRSVKSWL